MAQPQVVTGTDTTSGGGFNLVPQDSGVDPNLDPGTDTSSTDSSSTDTQSSTVDTAAADQQAANEARPHGWVPKEEWVAEGKDPSRWRSASEFLDVRHNVLAIVKSENEKYRAKIAALETKIAQREKQESDLRLRLTGDTLQEELRRAQEQNDPQGVAEATRKLVDHGIEVKTTAQPTRPPIDPEVQEAFTTFTSRNAWINTDQDLKMDFMLELKRIADVAPQLDMATALTQARRRVIAANPGKFRPNGRGATAMVETGGTGGSGSNGKSWGDLLPEVRNVAERDIAAKKYSKEEFLSNCDAEHFRR